MAAPEDTRRYQVATYAKDHPETMWVVHPSGENAPEWSIEATANELLHALPMSDPCAPAVASKLYEVTAGTLNVRSTPDTISDANKVGAMLQGTKFQGVAAVTPGWIEITEGTYIGRFVSATYARPI